MKKDKISVGIIGFGTVGTGTVKILLENKEIIKERIGFEINLRRIADLDIFRDRDIKLPKSILTSNVDDILSDPETDIVVELIGGIRPAKDFILKAIKNRKHVVTANKALLATEGNEIFTAAHKKEVEIGFEASVAGGIPIIKVIREGLVANRIKAIYGIINGTSNYILTKMTEEDVEFSKALKEAKALGYAEADPTLDIEGIDSAHMLPKEYLISKVDGPFNAIYIEGDATGSTLYYGRGAGCMPTGSAVVSDIVDIARNIMKNATGRVPVLTKTLRNLKIKRMDDVISMYYFRFSALDKPGVLSKISGILGNYNISIASVIQKGRSVGEAVPLVVRTHKAKERDVRQAISEIDRLPIVMDKTVLIRVEGKEN